MKLILGDCKEKLKEIESNSIDLMVTDPPYQLSALMKRWGKSKLEKEKHYQTQLKKGGTVYTRAVKGFMGKQWDVLPPVEVWEECLRVLKPGAFAFIMATPRQDSLCQILGDLSKAGFVMGFSSIEWIYASGFPKATNIAKLIDKRLGVKQEIIATKKQTGAKFKIAQQQMNNMGFNDPNRTEFNITKATSEQAKKLDGSYAGFQPKPAIEIILVCMKPLSEKTYIDQALKNGKGVTWLDNGRMPYESEDKPQGGYGSMGIGIGKPGEHQPYKLTKGGNLNSASKERKYDCKKCVEISSEKGRFPANLLVSDEVLNNYSRYFDLDKWWEERIKKLPESVRKTFPFLIIPKASKSEKSSGLKCNYNLKECIPDKVILEIKEILNIS